MDSFTSSPPMKSVVVIAGYGPSIGESVAKEFGTKGGFAIACLGRTKSALEHGVHRLGLLGIQAYPFVVDCGQPDEVKATVHDIQSKVGRISVIVWNAASYDAGDMLTADPNSLRDIVGVGCAGLLACVQSAYQDLKASDNGTVLITGGGLSDYDDQMNEIAVRRGWMGLAFCKSTQRKLAGLLQARLEPDGILVGTVIISGPVAIGYDGYEATNPDTVADHFWQIHVSRAKSAIHLGNLTSIVGR
jgi:NAD(P)-dependent dehydrogenase (short-subunit alcohol dehydrogenase family)